MNWLKKCLDSICSKYDVIIIDNNSSDSTIDFLMNYERQIDVIQNKENLGFGKANNLGIKRALDKGSDGVFLLNQDAYFQKNTVKIIIDFYLKNPEYGILSPIHLDGSGAKLDRNFSYYLSYDKNPCFYGDFILNKAKSVYDVPFVNAAAWFLPKKTLQNIGGFDPIFFHYGEDDNYCQRVKFRNLKIGVISNSFIYHDRENRVTTDEKLSLKRHLRQMETHLKVKYADINTVDALDQLNAIMRQKKIARLKWLLKLNFSKVLQANSEVNLIRKIFDSIERSRNQNILIGNNYLE
ncbi:glycosyltransferase [Croceiramulus getboli]|nr:glycosyltransferase [Flavobacteriaceae bacterium YJPT1-3]